MALHPLLEDGSEGTPATRCAFIGISNWALDPAKMNRGIFVQRGTPANNELEQIAKEICRSDNGAGNTVVGYIPSLAKAYLSICKAKKPEERDLTEFFGLRDFYSLMKMIVNFAKSTNGRLNRNQLEHSIKRNFGGFDPKDFNPMDEFINYCQFLEVLPLSKDHTPPTDAIDLIKATLSGNETALHGMESRYLLILTENLSVLNLVLNEFDAGAEVVFGSRFKDDVSYTQVCYNIFRIKMCMDKGTPVILLNLDDLYESLYDALNQYFTYLGNKKYVDLGLGTHRVKAFVADGFRLVVIADKKKVLSQFPIPLINRLEKHYVSASTMLTHDQRKVHAKLEQWMQDFATSEKESNESCPILCEGCVTETLNQPYRMPCLKHHIGLCCKERIFRENLPQRCPVRGCESDAQFEELVIDKQALENREYFENSTVDNCFIGYSSEATALIVKKVTTEVMNSGVQYEDMHRFLSVVEQGCKAYLIQCATAESVLRLDKTLLRKESPNIQHTYITEQNHESLLEYLESNLGSHESKPTLMQVTTFAEVMTEEDVELVRHHLNNGGNRYTVVTHYLKTFLKESQFSKALSSFYNRSPDKDSLDGVLIIQCEAANDCVELLDSVRYIIQRETKQSMRVDPMTSKLLVNHTVLLLSLNRGRQFNGYQAGEWRCVHIDDPRPPKFRLPSLAQCLNIKPSDLIAHQLTLLGHPDLPLMKGQDSAVGNSEADDDYASMPALEDDDDHTDDDHPLMAGDRELEATDHELENTDKEQANPQTSHIRMNTSGGTSILKFLEYCLPAAMSRIKCSRLLNTSSIMKDLLNKDQDFLQIFLRHVYSLMKDEEEYSQSHWVKADAAKASHMKKSETMRHAVEDALERAFVPAIAAVTAFIDTHFNLQLLIEADKDLEGIWRSIFGVCDTEGLSFKCITKGAASRLPESYYIDGDVFKNRYPFSWIVIHRINSFMKLPEYEVQRRDADGRWLISLLEGCPLGAIISNKDIERSQVYTYMTDFLHLAYPNQTAVQLQLMEQIMQAGLERQFPQGATLAHVHLIFEQLETQISRMNEIISLQVTKRKENLDEMILQKIKEEEQRYLDQLAEHQKVHRTASLEEPGQHSSGKEPKVQVQVPNKTSDGAEEVAADDIDLLFDEYEIEPPSPCDLLALEALIEDMIQVSLNEIKSKPEQWVNEIDQAKSLMERILNDGSNSQARRTSIGKKWCRLELQKLYVEHVVIPGPVEDGKRDTHKVLSFMKKHVKGTEFQEKECFDQVVGGLRMVVRVGIRSLFSNCPAECPACGKPLDSPAKLPCGHLLCDVCSKQNETCPAPECDAVIPKGYNYDPRTDDIDEGNLQRFHGLRQRLNKFFMNFVSDMVFKSDSPPPDDGILEWLMECVTFRDRTREFSMFYSEDVIDPTPVVRSFLLKLFLQCESPRVIVHLNQLMTSWNEKEQDLRVQKMAMLIDCYKDLYDHDLCHTHGELAAKLYKMRNAIIVADEPTVQLLAEVANHQCLLQQATSYVCKEKPESVGSDPIIEAMVALLKATETIGNRQISYYIMRQMLSTDGESRIKDFINTPMKFLVPADVQESLQFFTVPDIFSVYGGDTYRQAKSAIDKVIAESVTPNRLKAALAYLIMAYQDDGRTMLHSIFARVTRTLTHDVPVDEKLRDEIAKTLNNSTANQLVKVMGKMLLSNSKICPELRLDQAKGLNMMMLVLNTLTCFQHDSNTGLLNPLTEIISNPDIAKDHLFPTMEDNLMDLVYQNQRGSGDNTVPYRCPNGHLYYIGDCGRPYFRQRCPDCKAVIGGTFHEAFFGNRRVVQNSSALKTQPGYILGFPGSRGGPVAQRDLSMLSCAVMRCLTHLFMFTSALFNKRKVYNIVKPRLRSKEDITSFLEAHIQKDLQHISACCNENIEDCILLMHELLNNISTADVSSGPPSILSSMKARSDWESGFDRHYIIPIFGENKGCLLSQIKGALTSNRPESLNRVLSTTNQPLNTENILASAGLWIYRRPLTPTSVINLINSSNQEHTCLLKMVKDCDILTAVKFLPDILNLMFHLCKTYHSKYSRTDSKEISSSVLCRDPQIRKWIQSYVTAWNIAIHSASFNSSGSTAVLQDDPLMSDILPDKHAAMFTATTSNPRRLIEHLVTVHNGVISEDRSSIELREVSSYAVINLASKEQLLSYISAHIEYQLNAETKEQLPTYNLQDAERDIFMKYVGQRRRIKYHNEDLPSYMFQEDFNVLNQIKSLSDTQECLSIEQRVAMSDSAGRTIQTLSTYIKDLMKIISYLSVMPHVDMNQPLGEFMKKTLDQKKVPNYLKAEIQLKHVRSVWILLKHAQTDSFMRNKQDPFNDVDAEYNVEMSAELEEDLRSRCMHNSLRTKVLLEELFEFITIRLNKSVTVNPQEADDVEIGLQHALEGFIAQQDYERYEKVMEDIPQLPAELQVKHAPQAWQCIWKRFTLAKSVGTTV